MSVGLCTTTVRSMCLVRVLEGWLLNQKHMYLPFFSVCSHVLYYRIMLSALLDFVVDFFFFFHVRQAFFLITETHLVCQVERRGFRDFCVQVDEDCHKKYSCFVVPRKPEVQ